MNFREFVKVWTWIDRQWKEYPTHSVKRVYDFPVAGVCPAKWFLPWSGSRSPLGRAR